MDCIYLLRPLWRESHAVGARRATYASLVVRFICFRPFYCTPQRCQTKADPAPPCSLRRGELLSLTAVTCKMSATEQPGLTNEVTKNRVKESDNDKLTTNEH